MKTYSYLYDETYDPAMPIVEVILNSPESQANSVTSQAVIDTGADGSAVPESLLTEIGAFSIGMAIMTGFWGERKQVQLYLVHMEIGPFTVPAVRVAAVPDEVGFILERNAINQFPLHLNGPANTVEITSS